MEWASLTRWKLHSTKLEITNLAHPSTHCTSTSVLISCRPSHFSFHFRELVSLDALDGSYCSGDDPAYDPLYPDNQPGGYKGKDCGKYKPTKVISTSYAYVSLRFLDCRYASISSIFKYDIEWGWFDACLWETSMLRMCVTTSSL